MILMYAVWSLGFEGSEFGLVQSLAFGFRVTAVDRTIDALNPKP